MNYATAKTAADVNLEGVSVHFDKTDRALNAVVFRDAKGNLCRVSLQSYSMRVEVPAPPETAKRHVLRGELPVVGKFEKAFEQKWDADHAKESLPSEASDVTITEEDVVIDPAPAKTDDIPF